MSNKAKFFKPSSKQLITESRDESFLESSPEPAIPGNRKTPSDSPLPSDFTHGFSQSELEGLKESFALFDTEQSGSILAVDLYTILQSMHGDNLYPHLELLLAELSSYSDQDYRLDFDDYLALMSKTSVYHQSGDDETLEINNYEQLFQLFDLDRKGYIETKDLERVAHELGEYDITKEDLQEMIRRGDSKNEKRVYLEDFSKIMTLNLFQHVTT